MAVCRKTAKMTGKKQIIIIGLSACAYIGIFYISDILSRKPNIFTADELYPVKEKQITVKVGNAGKKLFFLARSWGGTTSHEQITLSQVDTFAIDKKTEYVFYSSEIYYKIDKKSRIVVYAPVSELIEPSVKFADDVVIIKGLKDSDEIRDYKVNYQKYGLIKIDAYD
jgi:hypothetical protein